MMTFHLKNQFFKCFGKLGRFPYSKFLRLKAENFMYQMSFLSSNACIKKLNGIVLLQQAEKHKKCFSCVALQGRPDLQSDYWPLAAFSTWRSSVAKSMASGNLFSMELTRKCINVCLPSCVFVFTSCRTNTHNMIKFWSDNKKYSNTNIMENW